MTTTDDSRTLRLTRELLEKHDCPQTDGVFDASSVKKALYDMTSRYDDPNEIDIAEDISLSGDASSLFAGFDNVAHLERLDVSHVTNMAFMFDGCYFTTTPDFSTWDTSNVTDMSCMFGDEEHRECPGISLNLSGFDTSKVTDMRLMFSGRQNPVIDVSGWDTSSVTNMGGMFWFCDHADLDVSGWNTSSVTDMSYMFASGGAPDVSRFDTSNVLYMNGMFQYSDVPDIRNFELSHITDPGAVEEMFTECYGVYITPEQAELPILKHADLPKDVTIEPREPDCPETNDEKLTDEKLTDEKLYEILRQFFTDETPSPSQEDDKPAPEWPDSTTTNVNEPDKDILPSI